jgi:hypothetical protein
MSGPKEFDMRVLLLSLLLVMTGCAFLLSSADYDKSAVRKQEAAKEKAATKAAKKAQATKKLADNKIASIDFSCKTDYDCKIKDLGSCCGYRPACVNKESKTYPEAVKAECSKKGMASICGFPSISSCTCTNNKCEGVAGPAGEESLQ